MNILFLTLVEFDSIQDRNIYTDLLREFVKNGHDVFIISPVEKKRKIETHMVNENHSTILRLQIGNTQKTNIIEKGISMVMIEPAFISAIKKYFSNVKFDLVLYTTPPITLVSAIDYVKNRDSARTYLLLKDIFPQNAVDLEMLTTNGIKGIIYKHFRKKEKRLYKLSDGIGCMSQANVNYVVKHNPEINPNKVEVCPNSVEIFDKSVDSVTREKIRTKYNIPLDKKVFVYGGNLGKPQGIPFLIECLTNCSDLDNVFFLIVGDGTEYRRIDDFVKTSGLKNVKLLKSLSKEDYDSMVGACDVGMIFLDHRFTIPNFPSRLLSYMQAKLPVITVTDPNTDIGKVITEGGFGWWCESDDINKFKEIVELVQFITPEQNYLMQLNEFDYLSENYSVQNCYERIINHFEFVIDKSRL